MGYVVPFMNGKGGVGKSTLARAYAVEAARAGATVLIADLDETQRTSKRWADHRKANGFKPEIRAEVATPRLAYDLADQADVLVIDTPGWTDKQTLFVARWSTFCVVPSRANRMDDLSETVRLLYALRRNGIEDWRFGVALNALRSTTAKQDDADARAYLARLDLGPSLVMCAICGLMSWRFSKANRSPKPDRRRWIVRRMRFAMALPGLWWKLEGNWR